MKKSTYRWEAGARRSDTRLDQKGRKFAKNAIGYAFFYAHFRLFLKTSLRNSLRTPASQHMFSKKFAYDSFFIWRNQLMEENSEEN
ncbi:hypothetical protein HYV57_05085 [Candidatus Peregrinibacteria bacterium]|nr:hypothetical protein [Candidatus Peregrinibacteria bacterium]